MTGLRARRSIHFPARRHASGRGLREDPRGVVQIPADPASDPPRKTSTHPRPMPRGHDRITWSPAPAAGSASPPSAPPARAPGPPASPPARCDLPKSAAAPVPRSASSGRSGVFPGKNPPIPPTLLHSGTHRVPKVPFRVIMTSVSIPTRGNRPALRSAALTSSAFQRFSSQRLPSQNLLDIRLRVGE